MNINYYRNDKKYCLGTTMKDASLYEKGNMALHICENPTHVVENRQQLANTLQIPLKRFVCANQTHSANVQKITNKTIGAGVLTTADAIENTDALYTFENNVVISSFTADCVPVLFYNEAANLIGAIHSGWQGTVKEISLKTFQQIINDENISPENIYVQIGTALSQEKFEVDCDVYEQFKALGYADDYMYLNEKTEKYHIDNQKTVAKQCILAGIPEQNISIDPTCTLQNETGFSYRQNKKDGRHLSFILQRA